MGIAVVGDSKRSRREGEDLDLGVYLVGRTRTFLVSCTSTWHDNINCTTGTRPFASPVCALDTPP